ncbi:hypothetical protein [Geobacter sp. OR-1]|uniref:hypothetical protein n=1 Tax=Geobacter sp. OR-1 TaxID=1266765 RepID=UPI001269C504|nr:hypothetical protein [Geobacter sp. OR-1]
MARIITKIEQPGSCCGERKKRPILEMAAPLPEKRGPDCCSSGPLCLTVSVTSMYPVFGFVFYLALTVPTYNLALFRCLASHPRYNEHPVNAAAQYFSIIR